MAPAPSARPGSQGRTPCWPLAWLVACVAAAAIAAIVLQRLGTEPSLVASTWGLFVIVLVWVGGAVVWGLINPGSMDEPDLANQLLGATNVLIGVDGVVLGLIYAFAGAKSPLPLVLKVATVALMVGLALALLLYALSAGKITTAASRGISTSLFNLSAWALLYGLLCITFALVYTS